MENISTINAIAVGTLFTILTVVTVILAYIDTEAPGGDKHEK